MAAVSKPTQDGRMEGASPCLPSPPSYADFSAEASQQIQTESNSENSGKTGYIPSLEFISFHCLSLIIRILHDKQGSLKRILFVFP